MDSAIVSELVRQQGEMGWSERVPMFAEIKPGVFKPHRDLNVGDCEQIVEWRSRLAYRAIFALQHGVCDRRTISRAAHNILLARLYRCQYLTLIGKTDSTEDDMPFPMFGES